MPREQIKYSKEKLENAIKISTSFAGVCRELGYKPFTGSQTRLTEKIITFGFDTSHFTGPGWNKDKIHCKEEYFSIWKKPNIHKATVKAKIIQERGRVCEKCNNTHWLEKPIVLELEHINGDGKDNRRENLKLLCPNCHSQTSTWRRKKSALVSQLAEETR